MRTARRYSPGVSEFLVPTSVVVAPESVLRGSHLLVRPREMVDIQWSRDSVCAVVEGLFLARRTSSQGLEVSELLFPGEAYAEPLIGTTQWTPPEIVAVGPGRLLTLGAAPLVEQLARPDVARWLLSSIAVRIRRAHNAIFNLTSIDAETRFASFLVDWSRATGSLTIPRTRGGLTQITIAAIVGTSRETVNKAMQRFRRIGLVDLDDDGGLTIVEPDELELLSRSAASYLYGTTLPTAKPSQWHAAGSPGPAPPRPDLTPLITKACQQ